MVIVYLKWVLKTVDVQIKNIIRFISKKTKKNMYKGAKNLPTAERISSISYVFIVFVETNQMLKYIFMIFGLTLCCDYGWGYMFQIKTTMFTPFSQQMIRSRISKPSFFLIKHLLFDLNTQNTIILGGILIKRRGRVIKIYINLVSSFVQNLSVTRYYRLEIPINKCITFNI